MALTPQEVLKLSQQGPLSAAQVQQLVTPPAPVTPTAPATPVTPTQPTSTTINTANLSTPATPITPTIPEQPVITTPAIPQALVQTDAEQGALSGADASLKRIADYKAQLAGQSAFTEQQKAQQDIIGKQAVQTQYTNQLNQAKQEAQGIQLQLQTTLQQQQESARGQGVTAGGLAPHLRATQTTANQALLSNAIKQYGIGASLAAAQGDLASALDYVDQAVKLQFDPITANLNAELANLEAIRGSSAYTAAEKKQAAALEYQVNQEIAANEDAKKEKTDIYDMAIKAQTLGADSNTIEAVRLAETREEAQTIMLQAGLFKPQMETDVVKLDNGETVVVDKATGKIVNRLGGAKPVSVETTTSGTDGGYGSPTTISPSAQSYVDMIKRGDITLEKALSSIGTSKDSAQLRNEIISGYGAQTSTQPLTAEEKNQKTVANKMASDQIAILDNILSHKNLKDVVGPNPLARTVFDPLVGGVIPYFTADTEGFIASVEQLSTEKTLEALRNLKASGATLGAVSEKELAILENSATKLNSWKVTDDNGKVTGYDVKESVFKAEVQKMLDAAKNLQAETLKQSGQSTASDDVNSIWGTDDLSKYFQ